MPFDQPDERQPIDVMLQGSKQVVSNGDPPRGDHHCGIRARSLDTGSKTPVRKLIEREPVSAERSCIEGHPAREARNPPEMSGKQHPFPRLGCVQSSQTKPVSEATNLVFGP